MQSAGPSAGDLPDDRSRPPGFLSDRGRLHPCRAVRYRMASAPLFVHCCHCRWCAARGRLGVRAQRDDRGRPRAAARRRNRARADAPSASGKARPSAAVPAAASRCWSHYAGSGDAVSFVRVGTLDDPDLLPPDIHIFTMSKQPRVLRRRARRPWPSTTAAPSTGRPASTGLKALKA